MNKNDGKHWLEPALKRHLQGMKAPEDAWQRMRLRASATEHETRWTGWFVWPAFAAGMVIAVAAGGHSYFKARADSGALFQAGVQAANPVSRGETSSATLRALAPVLKLEAHSACRLCHATAQL